MENAGFEVFDRDSSEAEGRLPVGWTRALTLATSFTPNYAQRVQNETVCQRQLLRLKHHSKGILDVRIERDAPGFVADDTLAVFTGGLGVIPVGVIPGCGIGEHR